MNIFVCYKIVSKIICNEWNSTHRHYMFRDTKHQKKKHQPKFIIDHITNYPPWKRGDIGLSLSVCPSVRPSVRLSVPFDVGYFVQASLVWRSWARASKLYTRINQGLKSCLVKVLFRSVENWRFWSTLKIVDFNFFFICQALCAGKFGLKRLS